MPRKSRTHLITGGGDGPDDTSSIRALTKEEFGRRLYRLMSDKGWIQSELARRSDIKKANISTYVRGESFPTPLNAERLAKALGVPTEELMPNYMAGAIADDKPDFEMKVSPADPKRAWLRINRAVSFETGMKIGALLANDPVNRE